MDKTSHQTALGKEKPLLAQIQKIKMETASTLKRERRQL